MLPQHVLDHACMYLLDQISLRKLTKRTAERRLAGQRHPQIKTAQPTQFRVRPQPVDQRARGQQTQHRFGHKCTRQRATIYLRLPRTPSLSIPPLTVDRQLDLRVLKRTDDLFEPGAEATEILLDQFNQLRLPCKQSLARHGAQDSIHLWAPSS